MSEEKSKLQLISEIAEANNKNLELIEEIDRLNKSLDVATEMINNKQEEIVRLNNILSGLEKYIHNELVLDFYNDDMPCELIINKMEKMIKELKENK